MNFAQLLFPDFSLILCGYLVCRYTSLDRRVWQPVEGLVYYFLFPVLLFQSVTRSPLDLSVTSGMLIAGVLMALASIAMSYSLPWLPVLRKYIDRREHAGAAQIAFRFNSFIGLAMADRLAGPQGLLLFAVLIAVCVPIYNVAAVWPMARHAQKGLVRELVRNPLIIATGSGLIANVLGFSMPAAIEPAVTRIGTSSLALGLLAAGAGMQFGSLANAKALAAAVLGIRHFATPLVAFGLARAFRLDAAQTAVLLSFAAVPTAPSSYVLAARMGYNGSYVAGLVTLSTLLGLVSLPFALGFLR